MSVPFKVDLSNQVAVITGGGGVLCSCMAKALASCGAKVAVLGRRLEPLQAVVDAIEAAGGTGLAVSCDVLDKVALDAANTEIEATLGPVDILLNGAGGNHPKGTTSKEYLFPEDLSDGEDLTTFFDLDPDGVQFVFDVNFQGTLRATQAFTRGMSERGRGCVINVSSMSAMTPLTKIPSYSAAKAGIDSFTKWLAVHMSKVGVRVNAISPGFFLTEQNRALLTTPDGGQTERGQKIIDQTPMGKYGDPDDLLGALLWLVSDPAAGFVTGAVIPVDGGFSAFSGV